MLLDRFLDDQPYYGLATVAPQASDRAAEEIDRLGDKEGLSVCSCRRPDPDPPLGEPENSDHLRELLGIVGIDSLLFESDYPHCDFDHPSEPDAHLWRYFDENERSKVLHGNAATAFDIKV